MAAAKCKKCTSFDRIDPDKGRCQRYPPTLSTDRVGPGDWPKWAERFPIVSEKDTCREFQEKT